jgi:hypothetical protein
MLGKRSFSCIKNGKCPERAGEQGCHLWWEYPVESGEIRRGCALSQGIMFPLICESIHFSNSAAVSADKATNAACEATLMAKEARQAGATAMAVVLGVVSGEIAQQPPQLEAPEYDEKIPPDIRPTIKIGGS